MTAPTPTGIKGLHHTAYRCRDSEETRRFYEDFLGLPLATTLELGQTQTGRACAYLHTFYEMDDGSYLAFFEAPEMPYEFQDWHDFDQHIALEVEHDHMMAMFAKGKESGIETRGVSDHDFIHSVYFRDPNGYVVELTTKQPNHDAATDPDRNGARSKLDAWQRAKAESVSTSTPGDAHIGQA